MAQNFKLMAKIAVLLVVWLTNGSAMASTFLGELPVGYSDNLFQISGGTSFLAIDIGAFGTRDPAICSFCNSSYTDNFSVNLFNQTGTLLKSLTATDYFYSSTYSSSHGIGAGPMWVTAPAGAATLEIQSQLFITGLLGSDGNPLSFGNLNISSDGSISAAATPIPSSLPLLATGLAALGLLTWYRKRTTADGFATT